MSEMIKSKYLEYMYTWTKYILFSLYALTIVGIWKKAPDYIGTVDDIFKIMVGFILLYFFNPLRKTKCTAFHRKVVFSAGIFLILSSSLKGFLEMVPVLKKII